MDSLTTFIKIVLMLTGIAVWVMVLSVVGGVVICMVRQWWDKANGI